MTPRHLAIVALLFTTVLIASLCAVMTRPPKPALPTEPPREVQKTNPLLARPNMVDRLDFFDTPAGLDRAMMQHVTLVVGPAPASRSSTPATTQPAATRTMARIVLSDQRLKSFPRSGTWTSDIIETAFPFTELIPSWNATVPRDTGVFFQVKTRNAADGQWSPWLYIGQWGRTPATDPMDRVVRFDRGMVNVDNLTLDEPANAYQFRATLLSFDMSHEVNPSIRRITVSYSGVVDDAGERERIARTDRSEPSVPWGPRGDWARSLPVPFRAQGIEAKPLAGQICSPTSTSMVMAYCGVDLPTEQNALAIYDEEHDMFGNWGRAVQRAGSLGLDAWLQRFRNWDQVKAMIARGQPIVAGIKFKKGEFPSALYSETDGHLIVIRGFTKAGDPIVNDPADRNKGNGVVYKADDLARAWFAHGGVGYVIRKPEGVGTSSPTSTTMPAVVVN